MIQNKCSKCSSSSKESCEQGVTGEPKQKWSVIGTYSVANLATGKWQYHIPDAMKSKVILL
jgi:hypothetical protein